MIPANVGLLQFLASSARRMPNPRLAALETIGVSAILSVMLWTPARSGFALPFLAVAMFGFWGIADHARRLRDPLKPDAAVIGLVILQRAAAIIGTAAITAAIFALAGWAIGPVIS